LVHEDDSEISIDKLKLFSILAQRNQNGKLGAIFTLYYLSY
jgi:hypothetical protein